MKGSDDSKRYHDTLGVRVDASSEEIDSAYANLKGRLSSARYAGGPLSELAKRRLEEIEVAYTELKKQHGSSHDSQRCDTQKCGYRPGYYRYYRRYYGGCCPDCGDLCTACACIWTADTCCECAGGDCI